MQNKASRGADWVEMDKIEKKKPPTQLLWQTAYETYVQHLSCELVKLT